MKKSILPVVAALALPCVALTGFDVDYDAAVKRAKASSKQVFVLFTGSDWCSWCVKLEEEVLSKREFLDYATNNWELVVADFPQKKKIAPELKKRYRELQKKYGVRGFPTVLLLDAGGNKLHEGGYSAGGAEAWLKNFLRGCKTAPLVRKYLSALEKKIMALGQELGKEMFAKAGASGDDIQKQLKAMKEVAGKYLPRLKELRKELAELKVPGEISDDKREMSEKFDAMVEQLEEMSNYQPLPLALPHDAADGEGPCRENRSENPITHPGGVIMV